MSADESDLLAAELALGLLDGAGRLEAEARLSWDPAFAAEHRRWLDLAMSWLDGDDAIPPASTWRAIRTALPANDEAHEARAARRWRLAALVAGAAALALGVSSIQRRPVAPAVPVTVSRPLVALLTGAHGGAAAIWVDRASGRLITAPGPLDRNGRSAELWVLPDGGKPRALGLLAAGASATAVPSGAAALLTPGAAMAVSLEPRGGSPTGQPTGPVVLTGVLAAS